MFDYSYIVHPEGTRIDTLAGVLEMCTPLGLIVIDHRGTRELVKPKPNPFLNQDMKSHFTSRLDTLEAYSKFKVNPAQ